MLRGAIVSLAATAAAVVVGLTVAPGALAEGGVTHAASVSDQIADKVRGYSARDVYNVVNSTASPESFTLGDKPIQNWGDYAVFGTPEQYAAAAQTGKAQALIKAARLPRLVDALAASSGYIAAIVGAATVYDQAVKMQLPGQGLIYKLISGQDWQQNTSPSLNWRWAPWGFNGQTGHCPTAAQATAFGLAPGTWKGPDGQVFTCTNGATPANGGGTSYVPFTTAIPRTGAGQYFVLVRNGGQEHCTAHFYPTNNLADYNLMLTNPVGAVVPLGDGGTATNNICNSQQPETVARLATEEQLVAAGVITKDATQADYDAATRKGDASGSTVTATQTGTGTDTQAEAAKGAVVPPPGTASTPPQQAIQAWVIHIMEPGWAPQQDYFNVPAPEPNETYGDYVQRLQDLGYLGAVTTIAETTPLDGYGPSAVTRVRLTPRNATQVKTYDPLAWPATMPQIGIDEGIVVRYNPDTATPIPDDPTGGDGTGTPPGGSGDECPCPIPPIVLPPLDTNACDKFPFGVFCWLGGIAAQLLNPTPIAPSITFGSVDFGTFLGVHLALPSITLDAADLPGPFATFFGLLHTAAAFLVWVLGLAWAGPRMLGMRGLLNSGSEGDE